MMTEVRRSGIIVASVALLCFLNALPGAFHYDDGHSLVRNPSIRTLANVPAFFADPVLFSVDDSKMMYRPLLLVTYALNHALVGYEAWGFTLVNLLLHAACTVLVWALARHLLDNPRLALVSGLLFAVHPLAAEPVNYVSSRSESLAALFYLAAFLCYVRRPTAGPCYPSLLFFALGLLSKSTALTLPLVLILYDYVRGRLGRGAGLRSVLGRHGLHWLVGLAYVIVIRVNGFLESSLEAPVRSWTTQLLTQAKAAAYYMKLLLIPVALNVEHQFSESPGPTATVAAGYFLLLSLAAVAWWARGRVLGFSIVWSAVVMLPATLMPLNMLVNERRLYLVLAAFAWTVGDLLGRSRVGLVLACIGLLAVLSFSRNRIWHDDLSLWQDAASKAPAMYRAQTNLGKALQLGGREAAAAAAYERALAIDPRHGDAYNNMAVLHHEAGRLD